MQTSGKRQLTDSYCAPLILTSLSVDSCWSSWVSNFGSVKMGKFILFIVLVGFHYISGECNSLCAFRCECVLRKLSRMPLYHANVSILKKNIYI